MNIYDEKSYAEKLLLNGPTEYVNFRDILILAKYFRYIGIKGKKIEESILKFLKEKVAGFNEELHIKKIIKAISASKKSSLRIFIPVPITVNEIFKIRELKNYRYEKVLFYLLVVAKSYKMTNTSEKSGDSKNYFASNKLNDHLRFSHVTQRKGENIFKAFFDLGYLDYVDKYDNLLLKYSDSDDISETFVLVTDMNNVISFYPPYCESCGKDLKKNANNQKLCFDCYKDKARKINRENMRKKRSEKNV